MSAANQRARDRAVAEAGVSSIIAAVLLLALFTTAFTLWSVAALPEWVADREERHSAGVRESVLAMQAGLDSLSAAGDSGPTSVGLDLGPQAVPVLQSQPALGTVGLEGSVRAVASFTNERILVEDFVARLAPDEDIDEGAGDVIDDIVDLDALLVELATTNVGNGARAWAEVVADDGDDTVTARITHAGKTTGSGSNVAGCLNSELRLEVTIDVDPVSPFTTTLALLCELGDDLSGYALDLGSRLSPFAQGVARLDTPYSIRLTDDTSGTGTATGRYAIAYTDSGGFGASSGSGEVADIEVDESGPRLAFDPRYNEFDGPAPAWELGALVLDQADGSAIDTAAGFRLFVADGVGQLEWTLVTLSGSGGRSGDGQATVQVRHLLTHDLVLTADAGAFTITSDAAPAWRAFFEDRILLAGAEGEATVGGTGTTASLTIGGGGATVDHWIIHLRLVTASIAVI